MPLAFVGSLWGFFFSPCRSAIFVTNDEQKAIATKSRDDEQKNWSKPITTEITAAATFYAAEDYHQHYFRKNGGGACHRIVRKH